MGTHEKPPSVTPAAPAAPPAPTHVDTPHSAPQNNQQTPPVAKPDILKPEIYNPQDNLQSPKVPLRANDKIVSGPDLPANNSGPAITDDSLRKEFGQYSINFQTQEQTPPAKQAAHHQEAPKVSAPENNTKTAEVPAEPKLSYDPAKAKEALRSVDTVASQEVYEKKVFDKNPENLIGNLDVKMRKDDIRANKLSAITGVKIDSYQNYVDTVDLKNPATPMHDVAQAAYDAELAKAKYQMNKNPETKNMSPAKKDKLAHSQADQMQNWEPIKKQVVDAYVDGYGSQTYMNLQKDYHNSEKEVYQKKDSLHTKYGEEGTKVLDKVIENTTQGKYPTRTPEGQRMLWDEKVLENDPELSKRTGDRGAYVDRLKKAGFKEQLENHGYDVSKTGKPKNYYIEPHQSADFMASEKFQNDTRKDVMQHFDKNYDPNKKTVEYEGVRYKYKEGQVQELPVDKIRDVQKQINVELVKHGEQPLKVDGLPGDKTRAAAKKYGFDDEIEKLAPATIPAAPAPAPAKPVSGKPQSMNVPANNELDEIRAALQSAGVKFSGETASVSAPTAHGQQKAKSTEPSLA